MPYLPLRPSVMTVHDLSPWKDPAWQAPGGVRHRAPYLLGLGLATMVIGWLSMRILIAPGGKT